MNFSEWVETQGGAKIVQRKLGVHTRNVWGWMAGRRLPEAAIFLKIHRVSKGVVTYPEMAERYLKIQKAQGRIVRRTRS